MTKILLTGTAGFIGFHLANRMLKEGWEVIGIDNINDYYDRNLKYDRLAYTGIEKEKIDYNLAVQSKTEAGYRFIKLNLEDRDNINRLFASEKFDYVCHLAAQAGVRYSLENPYAYIDSNITGFINIIEACRHHSIKHLTYASSSSVYGLNKLMPLSTHRSVNHPISLYAATKKSTELIGHTYSHLFNIPTTGLRFFTVYGPWGRPDMALFIFTKAILENKPIQIFNNGDMMRDFTYIDDIIEGVNRVIIKPAIPNSTWCGENPDPATSSAPYKIYNIGNSNPVMLLDFIKTIEEKLGKKAIKEYKPIQAGDVPKTFSDVTDLEKDLHYRPNTSVTEGISNFIDWYLDYYKIKR
ncbi:MAG: NAD-dependent epimerase [Bacteroidales bacterium]|nr:NAD-dependent epimerase [Bacteroidales bacterium]